MDNRRDRSDKYHQKKMHKQKHDKLDKLGFNQEEANLISSIQQMRPSELLKFMQNKFDKIIATNEKLFPKIATSAHKRMLKYDQQFKQNEVQRLKVFVRKHTGYTIQKCDAEQIFQAKSFQPFHMKNYELIHVNYGWSNTDPKIFLAKVSIFEPKQQFSNIKESFYIKGMKQNWFSQMDMKRFKKDCTGDLEAYVQESKIVQVALDQQW